MLVISLTFYYNAAILSWIEDYRKGKLANASTTIDSFKTDSLLEPMQHLNHSLFQFADVVDDFFSDHCRTVLQNL